MAILRIVKRTGDTAPFDRSRIHAAVTKAIRAVGASVEAGRTDAIVDGVVASAEARFGEAPPTVEHLQDLVEKALVHEGLYEVAKAYILYRADRQRDRDRCRPSAVERPDSSADGADPGRRPSLRHGALTGGVGTRRRFAPRCPVDSLVGEAAPIFDGMATTQSSGAGAGCGAFIERDPPTAWPRPACSDRCSAR